MNISISQKPYMQKVFNQCVAQNLNYRSQNMGLGYWSWIFDLGFQVLRAGLFSSYYKVWPDIFTKRDTESQSVTVIRKCDRKSLQNVIDITRCDKYYNVRQKIITKCDKKLLQSVICITKWGVTPVIRNESRQT